jgi:hypothetical protein
VGEYCDDRSERILTDLYFLSPLEYAKVSFFFCMPSLCVCNVSPYVWVCASLASERLEGFYSYSLFKSLSIVGRYPMNINILAPKIGVIQVGPETQN